MEAPKYDIFISYSRKDTAIADHICRAFDEAGITYFIDRQGIGGGLEFPTVLANAILGSRLFLYLASENAYQSKFTGKEVTFAFNKMEENCLLPYIIDGSRLPSSQEFIFSSINWRTLLEHPIDTVLVPDLLGLLGREPRPTHAAPASGRGLPEDGTRYEQVCDYKFPRTYNAFFLTLFVALAPLSVWGGCRLWLQERTVGNIMLLLFVGYVAIVSVWGGWNALKGLFPRRALRTFHGMSENDLVEVPSNPSKKRVVCSRGGKYGIIDLRDIQVHLPMEYDLVQEIDATRWKRLFRVYCKQGDTALCGLCDEVGNWYAHIKYAAINVDPEREGHFIAVTPDGNVQKLERKKMLTE